MTAGKVCHVLRRRYWWLPGFASTSNLVLRLQAAESVSQRGSRRAGALAEGATVHCQCGPLAATMAAATASTAAASRGMAPPAGSRSRVAVHNTSAGKAFVGEGG